MTTRRRVKRGTRNIQWIERYCRVPEGQFVGQPLKLRPWQKKELRRIYDNPHGTRRAILSFARKNGKTALAAVIVLLHLCGPEAVPNGQLYSAARARDQAALLFSLAAKMVRLNPDLSSVVTIRSTRKELECAELGTLYRALSADADTNLGASPALMIHDELGQVKGPRSALYDALETAAGAQTNPLSIIISTQAPTNGDLLSILIDDALTGANPRTVVSLYTADEKLDPFSVKALKQANPAFGDFLNAEETLASAADAKRMPSREAAYRNLILNQRVNQNSPFVPAPVWHACGGEIDPGVFERNPVSIGLDLSSKNDLTALVMVAREDSVWHVMAQFYAPEIGLLDRAQRDRTPYDVWRDQGFLMATPGASVDYEWVARRLVEIAEDYDLSVVKFDRWRIDVLKAELTRLGVELPLEPHGQGYKDMAPALDTLEAELAQGRIRHGENPILTWNAANAIATFDPVGNRKLDKAMSFGRIDGMVALAMALTGGNAAEPKRVSIYEQGVI